MARGASARKTSGERSFRTPKHGHGRLSIGNPGNKGGGRHSNKFLELCLKASEDPYLWHASAKKQPLGLLDLSASYAYGKPVSKTELTGDVTIRVEFDD